MRADHRREAVIKLAETRADFIAADRVKVVSQLVRFAEEIDPVDIEAAAKAVTKAGEKILSKGEFCPGEPYLFFTDPDGYEVEIWFELPTPVDPKR